MLAMDFKDRLLRATERGQQAKDTEARKKAAQALSEEECRRLHSSYRLELTEHIEPCLRQLADNFPGFNYETVVDETGWGAAIRRDDLSIKAGRRDNLFSRLSMTISPHSEYHVLDLKAKGTVRNKENFSRNHYQLLKDADLDSFKQLIEQWTLDYAEQYAANNS
ncbi:MAG: hypothetical protein GXP26_06265 [Planctomycetes bacterium]|nr:hypothetical protein [Planctomycetota bacterium]